MLCIGAFQGSLLGVFHSLGKMTPHFFLPPFFAFFAVALPWFCLDCFPPADPFLPLFADLAIRVIYDTGIFMKSGSYLAVDT
jgi:hypothetical protein